MSIHHIECAALADMPPSRKLVFMAICDSADKNTGEGFPGFDMIQSWSGLGRSQVQANIAALIDEGWISRVSAGRRGARAVFRVFDQRACCVMHDPMSAGSGTPDPKQSVPEQPAKVVSVRDRGRLASGIGAGLDRTPSQHPSIPAAAAARGNVLPEQIQQLADGFADVESLDSISFTMRATDLATVAALVDTHGVPRLVRAAAETKTGKVRRATAFIETWSGLRPQNQRTKVVEPMCPGLCGRTVSHCARANSKVEPEDRCEGVTA